MGGPRSGLRSGAAERQAAMLGRDEIDSAGAETRSGSSASRALTGGSALAAGADAGASVNAGANAPKSADGALTDTTGVSGTTANVGFTSVNPTRPLLVNRDSPTLPTERRPLAGTLRFHRQRGLFLTPSLPGGAAAAAAAGAGSEAVHCVAAMQALLRGHPGDPTSPFNPPPSVNPFDLHQHQQQQPHNSLPSVNTATPDPSSPSPSPSSSNRSTHPWDSRRSQQGDGAGRDSSVFE